MDEKLINYAQKILHDRCVHWQQYSEICKKANVDSYPAAVRAIAYKSACDILQAAVMGEEELLKEFDCYASDL